MREKHLWNKLQFFLNLYSTLILEKFDSNVLSLCLYIISEM